MLSRQFVVGASHGALEQAPHTFNGVGVDITPRLFLGAVADRLVGGITIGDPSMGGPLVRDNGHDSGHGVSARIMG